MKDIKAFELMVEINANDKQKIIEQVEIVLNHLKDGVTMSYDSTNESNYFYLLRDKMLIMKGA